MFGLGWWDTSMTAAALAQMIFSIYEDQNDGFNREHSRQTGQPQSNMSLATANEMFWELDWTPKPPHSSIFVATPSYQAVGRRNEDPTIAMQRQSVALCAIVLLFAALPAECECYIDVCTAAIVRHRPCVRRPDNFCPLPPPAAACCCLQVRGSFLLQVWASPPTRGSCSKTHSPASGTAWAQLGATSPTGPVWLPPITTHQRAQATMELQAAATTPPLVLPLATRLRLPTAPTQQGLAAAGTPTTTAAAAPRVEEVGQQHLPCPWQMILRLVKPSTTRASPAHPHPHHAQPEGVRQQLLR